MSKHTLRIPGSRDWHGYDVTPDGHVFSHTGWRGKDRFEIKQSLDAYGYPAVRLIINGKRKRERVHKLVASLFHGDKPSQFHQVCHRDGNPMNNCAENLYWGDARENAADRSRHGRTSRGPRHSSAIIAGQANARLIAAAPELLEALEYAIDSLGGEFALPADVRRMAKDAIAKARGES